MSINRVIIEGYLTRDVEMRATASGLAVAGFTVAAESRGCRSARIAANPASTMALRATRCTRCVKTWRGR